jgi:hypothetical protein
MIFNERFGLWGHRPRRKSPQTIGFHGFEIALEALLVCSFKFHCVFAFWPKLRQSRKLGFAKMGYDIFFTADLSA